MTTELWGPSADGLDLPYWEGLRAGELRLQRCAACRTWIWGPQWLCGHCHTFDPSWEQVAPSGTVYSWSRSWYPFITELDAPLPYVTVLVELPNAGDRRVLGLLVDAETDSAATPLRIGQRVVGDFATGSGTWPTLAWRRAATGA